MFTSRANTVSLLALTMSVYVCLLATANPQALAQRSLTVTAAHAQLRKGASTVVRPAVTAQSEAIVEEFSDNSARLSNQEAETIIAAIASQETSCALLSKYLSLS